MAAERRAWVLNLDADLELAKPRGYTPKQSVKHAMASFVPVLVQGLLGPHDVLVDESSTPLSAQGLPGRAFCPTPRALALLRRAGAEPEPAPSLDVLRRVNSRAFASSLGATLPGAAFVTSLDEARIILASLPPLGDTWRIKRAFGMAGRGHRLVTATRPTDADFAFVRAGMSEGGVQVEPNVTLTQELAIHAMLGRDGAVRIGAVVEQQCDARGAWQSTMPLAEGAGKEAEAMRHSARHVAAALAHAGYFGPFGIDGYAYRGVGDAVGFQPRSEINARYSMGFGVGLREV